MVTYDNYRLLLQVAGEHLLLLGSQTMNIPDALADEKIQAVKYLNNTDVLPGISLVEDVDINEEAQNKHDLSVYERELWGLPWKTIADFGTLEHVEDIANCLRNVFAWLDKGGTAIHVNPSVDYIDEAHSKLPKFTAEFWEAYAKLTNMNILLLDYKPAYAESTAIECRVVLEKTSESKAPTKAKIESLMKKHLK